MGLSLLDLAALNDGDRPHGNVNGSKPIAEHRVIEALALKHSVPNTQSIRARLQLPVAENVNPRVEQGKSVKTCA